MSARGFSCALGCCALLVAALGQAQTTAQPAPEVKRALPGAAPATPLQSADEGYRIQIQAATVDVHSAPDEKSPLFKSGAEWAGVCYAVKDAVTFVAAFALMAAARLMDRRHIHGICLALGAVGLLAVGFIHGEEQKSWLLVALALGGVAWASILSMPYALLAGALPPERMGVYMGIFNFFIVLPEIIAALTFGPLVKHLLGGNLVYAVMAGGGFMLLAALLTQWVQAKPAVTEAIDAHTLASTREVHS